MARPTIDSVEGRQILARGEVTIGKESLTITLYYNMNMYLFEVTNSVHTQALAIA